MPENDPARWLTAFNETNHMFDLLPYNEEKT